MELIAELNQTGNYLGGISSDDKLIFNSYSVNESDGYVDLKTGAVVYFSFDSSLNGNYSWCPTSNEIIFVSERDGIKDLYLMDLDTGEINRITYLNSSSFNTIGWLNDGNRFVFFITDYGQNEGNNGLYIVSKNGLLLRNILPNKYISTGGIPCACPHLFIHNGAEFQEIGEIIGQYIYTEYEGTDRTEIDSSLFK
ncbi:Tol-Pal system protein TolB [subsurface metagenome]